MNYALNKENLFNMYKLYSWQRGILITFINKWNSISCDTSLMPNTILMIYTLTYAFTIFTIYSCTNSFTIFMIYSFTNAFTIFMIYSFTNARTIFTIDTFTNAFTIFMIYSCTNSFTIFMIYTFTNVFYNLYNLYLSSCLYTQSLRLCL
jgi:hypothetical protein